MKRGTYVFIALLVLLTTVYFGAQSYRYLSDPFSTVLAYRYRVEQTLDLSGYVIRTEQAIPGEISEFLRISRTEGERVAKGGTVAVVYADQESLERQAELERVTDRLNQLTYARDLRRGAETASRLDGQIFRTLVQYRSLLAADRMDRAAAQGAQLRSLVFRRDYTGTDTPTLEAEIAALEGRRAEMEAASTQVVRRITAPVSGLYSGVADGYEFVLTPELAAQMTPSVLQSAAPERTAAAPIGKLITEDVWYYAAVLSARDAEMLRKRSEEGASLALRFSKGAERDFPVELYSVGPEENRQVVALFKSDRYLSEVTLLRRQTARLIYGTVEGLRTPREALRIASWPKDSENAKDVTGLYCVIGTEARFKPADVVYRGDTYLLLRPAVPDGEEKLRLRVGDEIVVRAEELYDGKVISAAG